MGKVSEFIVLKKKTSLQRKMFIIKVFEWNLDIKNLDITKSSV